MNETENIPYGETCVLQSRNPGHPGFAGDYLTVWFEQTNQNIPANLSIRDNNIGNASTFDLTWRRQQTPIFRGVAMLYGELLVGTYWAVDK